MFRFNQCKKITDIYLSSKKFFPIQAIPGYGKTALFQIPIKSLKLFNPRKAVHFVLVRYITLLANMIERLSTGGLVVKAVRDVISDGAPPDENELDGDIYV